MNSNICFRYLIILIFLFPTLLLKAQSIGINEDGSNPFSGAILHLKSSNKGLLIPRLTSLQRQNMPNLTEGLLVWDGDENSFWVYDGANWEEIPMSNLNIITDNDHDTGINLEQNPDEDFIRFQLKGSEMWMMKSSRLEPHNSSASTFIGIKAGELDDGTDKGNIAIGRLALSSNVDRPGLIAIGDSALHLNGTGAGIGEGERNIAIGTKAMINNTLGYRNIALGDNALQQNIDGFRNIAIGSSAMKSNESGTHNVAIGVKGLEGNLSGDNNSAFGYWALTSNTSGENNTSMGYLSTSDNTIGTHNAAFGYLALKSNIDGNYNTAIGSEALKKNDQGKHNTALGNQSLFKNTSGNTNTGIGDQALYTNTDRSFLVAVGDSTLYHNGTSASQSIHSTGHTAIGSKALYNNTTGYRNTAIGFKNLYSNTTGFANTAMGYEALYNNTNGEGNIAVGNATLRSNTTGHHNNAFGLLALFNNTSGIQNLAIGHRALYTNTSGDNNISVGDSSLTLNTTGYDNISMGSYSLSKNTNGFQNIAIGKNALSENTTGDENIAIGTEAMDQLNTGAGNISIGHHSNNVHHKGSFNTTVGYDASIGSNGATNVDNCTLIGNDTYVPFSNAVRIGNTAVTSIGGYANWVNLSDGRFKQNVQENIPGLNFINGLRPVSYQINLEKLNQFIHGEYYEMQAYENNDEQASIRHSGFIAQEVEALSETIGFNFSGVEKPKNEKSHYGLKYAEFVVPLVKAIQELDQKNINLEDRLAILEAENRSLQQQVQKIDQLEIQIQQMVLLLQEQKAEHEH